MPTLREARIRYVDHYEEVLIAANGLFMQGDTAIQRGLKLFDLEWGNIEAGLKWMEANSAADDDAAEYFNDYLIAGTYLFDLRQHPEERMRLRKIALDAAIRLEHYGPVSAHLGNIALAYNELGDSRTAIDSHERSLRLFCELGDQYGEVATLTNLGLAYADLGEFRRAIQCYEEALTSNRDCDNSHSEASILNNLGVVYKNLGEVHQAIQFHEQALQIFQKLGDRRGESNTSGNLGLTYAALGEIPQAIECYESSLMVFREMGDLQGEAKALGNLGIAYKSMGNYAKAVVY